MLSTFLTRIAEIHNVTQLDGRTIGDQPVWRACLELFDDVEQSDVDWSVIDAEGVVKQGDVMVYAQQDWVTDFTSTLQTYADLPEEEQVARNTEFGTKLTEMLDVGVARLDLDRRRWTDRMAALNLM